MRALVGVDRKSPHQLDPDGQSIPYALFADFDEIRIFQSPFTDLSEPACSFKTADVLVKYQPEFGRR